MKKIISGTLILWLLAGFNTNSRAQQQVPTFDTIYLKQTQAYFDDYTLNDSIISRISIQASAPVQMNDVKFKIGGDMWRGALTLISGIGISGAKDVDWYLAASIRTNNSHYDWVSDIYCPGYIEKQRTRTTDSDGSHGVETSYVNVFSWNRGALGYIIEAGDTIGWHYVIRTPKTDTSIVQWVNKVYKSNTEKMNFNPTDFACKGEFLGKVSVMLYNAAENRMYIFRHDELLGICQFAKIPSPLVRKKKRVYVQPYLLVSTGITAPDKTDLLRLSITGKRFKNAMESYHQ
jgi:hypothetical protein